MPYAGTQPGPAWYDSSWLYRWPIAVDAVTGGDSGSVDINVVVPATWDWFWDGVQDTANGYDIIVCGSDGVTLLDFQYSGFNHTNRTLTIQIDAFALAGTGKMELIWLYWYKTSPSNLTTSFTPASPITGYIYRDGPVSGYSFVADVPLPGETTPRFTVAKKTTETLRIWVDITYLLSLSPKTYNGKYCLEGVSFVTASTQGATPLQTDANTRYVYYNDRLWASCYWSGGADDTDYIGIVTTTTTNSLVYDTRFTFSVDDLT